MSWSVLTTKALCLFDHKGSRRLRVCLELDYWRTTAVVRGGGTREAQEP